MAEPWFDESTFGALFGSIVGGVGGSLMGILGGLAGWLAPKGVGRSWMVGAFGVFLLGGLVSLCFGIYALTCGQPYGIWYPLLLCGVLFTALTGGLLPVLRRRYAEAEQRRLEAENIRTS
jgi:hypothetical protein